MSYSSEKLSTLIFFLEEGVKVHKAHTAMKYCFPRPGLAIIRSVSIPVPREGPAVNLKKENVRLFLHIQVIKRLCHTHTPRL